MSGHHTEITEGNRFEFGKNWSRFLSRLNEERIIRAENSLKMMLEAEDLRGRSFLDIGCGSGLFSLAARRLVAHVRSFDYDPQSAACTRELKRRYFPEDAGWVIEEGSILDRKYVQSLGRFDIVYSWGVLHHTSAMMEALEMAGSLVADGGRIFIAIYNNQGGASRRWASLKSLYNHSPRPVRWLLVLGVGLFFEVRSALIRLCRLQNPLPFKDWAKRREDRGMSVWHDLVDWVGGYPFEVAKPEEIFNFFKTRGFILTQLKTCGGGLGCNEYVFVKREDR
ncbi:MAG: class I SAM-dependent methyltransferase [Candidatus Sumerlaeota bacterium]|nr:class I SAM-dependent methyltransferase [Candidatus Sumerlaeota bacterium]